MLKKLKFLRNRLYIKRNYKKVLKKLKNKIRTKKLEVVFYVYDSTKWKCDALYDLLLKDGRFNVKILVTKTDVEDIHNPSFQTGEDVKKTYNFFAGKGMNVEYAWKNGRFIPFEDFTPDIIIYQHPWYVERTQGPVVCSKFALTCYVPYYFPTTTAPIDYYLRFHQYVERYYIFDEITREVYVKKMQNHGKNLKVTGQPFLDYFRLNPSGESKYTIYAPHWTVAKQGIAYGTFEWNGMFLLEYAKKHPEKNWVFKPHPLLFKALVDKKIMTLDEVQNYYNEWENIGLRCESGDYLELFNNSQMLITDCSSFLGEYFMTEKPVIHLISPFATPYNKTVNRVIKHYYRAENIEDLKTLLERLPEHDTMKEERMRAVEELGFKNNYASKNILDDIIQTIEAV